MLWKQGQCCYERRCSTCIFSIVRMELQVKSTAGSRSKGKGMIVPPMRSILYHLSRAFLSPRLPVSSSQVMLDIGAGGYDHV